MDNEKPVTLNIPLENYETLVNVGEKIGISPTLAGIAILTIATDGQPIKECCDMVVDYFEKTMIDSGG